MGALLLDVGFECGTVKNSNKVKGLCKLKKLLAEKIHGKKLDNFKKPAEAEQILRVDFSNAEDKKIAELGKLEFELIDGPTKSAGGGACNALSGIKKMLSYEPDLSCQILAKIGEKNGAPDNDGKELLNFLGKNNIDTNLIRYDKINATGRSVVVSFAYNNKRNVTYLIYRGAARELEPADLVTLNNADIIGGIVANTNNPQLTLDGARILSSDGRRAVYISSALDMEFIYKELQAGNKSLLDGLENVILTVNEHEFDKLADNATKQKVVESFHYAVITKGTNGIDVYNKNFAAPTPYPIAPNRPTLQVPANQINPNGAGDALSACIASYYVPTGTFNADTIEVALCVAACVCTRTSTTAGVPTFRSASDGADFAREWRDHSKPFDFANWGIK